MPPIVRSDIPRECPSDLAAHVDGRRKIFIFGSARSGTSLLSALFRTFDVSVSDAERCFRAHVVAPGFRWAAAKRTPYCAEHLIHHVVEARSVWIIDIIRDPRDVVCSVLKPWRGYYCDFDRWRRDFQVSDQLRGLHERYLRVGYESLVSESSDEIQAEIASRVGLAIRARFSAFPMNLADQHLDRRTLLAMGGLRALSTSRIQRWRHDPDLSQRVQDQRRKHPDLDEYVYRLGYDP